MRKSKLFLTGSLLVMTIVAVSATKGMKFAQPFYYYLKGNTCVLVSEPLSCAIGQPICKYVEAAGIYQEYATRINSTRCINPLQPDDF